MLGLQGRVVVLWPLGLSKLHGFLLSSESSAFPPTAHTLLGTGLKLLVAACWCEAFVSGASKGSGHIADARLAVEAFVKRLPQAETEVRANNPMSLAAIALLRAGWQVGFEALHLQCLVIKACTGTRAASYRIRS